MEYEEVIININALNAVCGQKEFYDKGSEEALKIAVECIEKQIPKKPICRWTGDETVIECPTCGKYPFDTSEHEWARQYCGSCGQAIDWSEADK